MVAAVVVVAADVGMAVPAAVVAVVAVATRAAAVRAVAAIAVVTTAADRSLVIVSPSVSAVRTFLSTVVRVLHIVGNSRGLFSDRLFGYLAHLVARSGGVSWGSISDFVGWDQGDQGGPRVFALSSCGDRTQAEPIGPGPLASLRSPRPPWAWARAWEMDKLKWSRSASPPTVYTLLGLK